MQPTTIHNGDQIIDLEWKIQNGTTTAAMFDHCQGTTEIQLIGCTKKITVPNCVSIATIESCVNDDDTQYFVLQIKFAWANYYGVTEIYQAGENRNELIKIAVNEINDFDIYLHMYDESTPGVHGM